MHKTRNQFGSSAALLGGTECNLKGGHGGACRKGKRNLPHNKTMGGNLEGGVGRGKAKKKLLEDETRGDEDKAKQGI